MFVLEVVRSAVALPQADPQDRLRVLNAAVSVTSTISTKFAAQLAQEGVRIESELIANGQTPVVSLLASGRADCKTVSSFVDSLYPKSVKAAEQSLIGAISKCPKGTLEPVRQRADAAMEQGIVAPRLFMALMERTGTESGWTQDRFVKIFSSLPGDPHSDAAKNEAPNYAAMFATMSEKLDKGLIKTAGLKLLQWLGKIDPSGERSMAVSITTSAMKKALGEEKYQEAIAGDVMARQAAESSSIPGGIPRPPDDSASVLRAMEARGTEQQDALRELPPSLRAREAAAHGFSRGVAGDRKAADSFFDMAFVAADETWERRNVLPKAAEVIEEVCEAAAQVDIVSALSRAQRLQDPTAQAIGMIAVARVVASRDLK